MKRQLFNQLQHWKQSSSRKPLLLMGARQVGKTTLLHQFAAADYNNCLSLNFDSQPNLKTIFDDDLDPNRILRDLSLEFDMDILPGKTLIIFDEIQECPNALNSLKCFNEQANEYHICGAGSLLGVKLSHVKGFPVGKVHFKTLFPLSFIEFLEALEQKRLSDYLQNINLSEKINTAIHEKIIRLLKEYFLVGGMPEAVKEYAAKKDFSVARKIHRDIIKAYELDFVKHAPLNLIPKISACFHSIPSQLAKENKKFIYSVIREGARARGYEDALQWLMDAGLIHKVYNINTPKLPLIAYENSHIFKAYILDVGLLNTMAELPIKAFIQQNALFQEVKGFLTENFVTQELIRQHEKLYYWTSSGQAEIDFILQNDSNIYPLEVKSGNSGRKKSLQVYNNKYSPKLVLRTSPQNLIQQNNVINIPLYLVGELAKLLKLS